MQSVAYAIGFFMGLCCGIALCLAVLKVKVGGQTIVIKTGEE